MTKKSFLTKKRLLIACGVLGLVATAACVLRAERLHGFLRPHIPIIEEIELKEVPSRDEEPQTAEVQTEVIQASIGVQTAQPADNVSRGVQTEPFYVPVVSKAAEVQTEVIQASVGMQAGQQVKYVSTGIQPESFGIPEHIQELLHRVNALGQREAEQKRALMNNVVHWNNLSEEERDLLGDTHVVPESFVTNPVCWNSLAADQQDLLLETGALSERVLFHS